MKPAKQALRVQVTLTPRPDALRSWSSALDLVADWMAGEVLKDARAEAAAVMGVEPSEVAPEPSDVAGLVRDHGRRLVGGAS